MQARREAQFAVRIGDGRGARARWSSYRLGQLGALALGAPRAFVLSAVGSFFSAGPPAAVRAVAMRVASEPGVLLTLAGMIQAFLLGQGPSEKLHPPGWTWISHEPAFRPRQGDLQRVPGVS